MGENETAGRDRLLAGRYRVVELLGRGGMGAVWRAVDETLGREVAVKELRTFSDTDGPELADLRLRMQREARAAARVRHPGVVAVHDVTEHDGRPVIVMELVDGPSLADVLHTGGPMDPAEAARIGAKVLDALAAAHRVGVLHRDVKPGNILLEAGTGRVLLTDFGIATVDEPDDGAATRLTRSGELVGSLDYLSPERARGGEPGPPSDVWALGATLYAAVEGTAPFRRTSTWSTITAIVVDPLPEPQRAGPLGPALRELMEKDPEARADAVRAAQLLAAVAAGEPTTGRTPDTMRLGPTAAAPPPPETSRPGVGAPPPGQFGPPPPVAAAPWQRPASAAEGAPHGAAHRDDAPTRPGTGRRSGSRRGRKVAIAAAAAAVVLAGAGATYLVGTDDAPEKAAASKPAQPSDLSASARPDKNGDQEPNDRESAQKPSEKASPIPSRSQPGAAAGTTGDGGDTGGSSGSGGAGGTGGTGTTSGGTAGGGSGGGSTPQPSCHAIGGGKYNCEVWATATSYDSAHRPVGTLYSGTNYFYCQVKLSHRETHGRWTNVWWAQTDDDKGHTDVRVSVVYITGGANDQAVPGLPVC